MPRSNNSARAVISFSVTVKDSSTSQLTLEKGLVSKGILENTSYLFSIIEDITVQTEDVSFLDEDGNNVSAVRANFNNIEILQELF